MRTNSATVLFSLNAGKIRFIPFQFRPLARILLAERPRILIADEVGVGKTIETGLIIKEFQRREQADKILIICPKDLTRKWQTEMRVKFDACFEILDSGRLDSCLRDLDEDGVWPRSSSKCIIGLELLRRRENLERLRELDCVTDFDMVIVDEAHHVINRGKNSHGVVEYFCENSTSAVFLSATPLQLDAGDLFSLLNLLLPEEFMDEAVFDAMAEPNQYINKAIRYIRQGADAECRRGAAEELQRVGDANAWARQAFAGDRRLRLWIERLADTETPLADTECIACLRDLESLHTFAHVVNRTKRKDIGAFTIREPQTIRTDYTEAEYAFYKAATDFRLDLLVERYGEALARFVRATIERMVTSSLPAFARNLDRFLARGLLSVGIAEDMDAADEADEAAGERDGEIARLDAELRENFVRRADTLRKMAAALPSEDAKVEALLRIVADTVAHTAAGKLLVFSFFKHTLAYLEETVRARTAVRIAVITGDTDYAERFRLRDRFRLPKDAPEAIDVLLCSEVGCEGLDYEFCSRMVNYDLPWNPMRVEQRIGRIDRFGQPAPKVQIYNFITARTVEEQIFEACFERLNVFERTIGDLEGVLGGVSSKLERTAFDTQLTPEQRDRQMRQIADNVIRLADEQRLLEDRSRNLFLMDVQKSDRQLADDRALQARWQRLFVLDFLRKRFPHGTYQPVGDDRLSVRLLKNDRQELLRRLAQLVRERQLDRNSPQLKAFTAYLEMETPPAIVFSFTDEAAATTLLTTSHPLYVMALKEASPPGEVFYTSAAAAATATVAPGRYVFAFYRWQEIGYLESTDIQALLYDAARDAEVAVSTAELERLLLASRFRAGAAAPDLSCVEDALHRRQEEARERLARVNEDLVARKRSTVDKFFTATTEQLLRKIAKLRENPSAGNERIVRMLERQLERKMAEWEAQRDALAKKSKSDVVVKLLAAGTLEVK